MTFPRGNRLHAVTLSRKRLLQDVPLREDARFEGSIFGAKMNSVHLGLYESKIVHCCVERPACVSASESGSGTRRSYHAPSLTSHASLASPRAPPTPTEERSGCEERAKGMTIEVSVPL